MDLKALIAKMDQIDSNTILNEGFPTVADAKARAEKEKTTGKFDKKDTSTGTVYTRKSSTFTDGGDDADTKKAKKKAKNEDISFNSSIAQSLVEEFGYEVEEDAVDERVTINPDGTTSGGIAPAPAAAPAAAASPWANDPAKDAAWKALSPEDQKWLGGADPTDPFILARAPNKGKPAAPAAAAPAAAAPADVVNPDEEEKAKEVAAANTAAGGAATKPAAVDPAVAATREKFKALMDKLEKTGGVSGAAAAPAAAPAAGTGAATKPSTGFANTGGGAAVGNPNMAKQGVAKESVNYEDDQVLLAIKNIKF